VIRPNHGPQSFFFELVAPQDVPVVFRFVDETEDTLRIVFVFRRRGRNDTRLFIFSNRAAS